MFAVVQLIRGAIIAVIKQYSHIYIYIYMIVDIYSYTQLFSLLLLLLLFTFTGYFTESSRTAGFYPYPFLTPYPFLPRGKNGALIIARVAESWSS